MTNARAPFPPENDAELLDGTDAVINPNPDNNVKATPFVEPNTTNVIIHTRQAPVGAGTDSGISVSTYAGENCQGDEGFTYEKLLYNVELAHALQSYSLSSDLGPDDVLGYATATPCSDSFFTLGAQDITQGCHTLPEEANCMAIWVSSG